MPLVASRHRGLSKNWKRASSCAITAARRSPMSISRRSPAGDRRPAAYQRRGTKDRGQSRQAPRERAIHQAIFGLSSLGAVLNLLLEGGTTGQSNLVPLLLAMIAGSLTWGFGFVMAERLRSSD